jgi:pyridinium-3,5-biscarboxylic acid mononucleotide sulfurtransferase
VPDLLALRAHLASLGRVLLGYSGGVDSALLAVVGRQALGPERFLAVIGRSASYPEAQYRSAVDIARRFDVPLLEVETGEMADPDYRANPVNRCYFCKTELWTRLGDVARDRGLDLIIDGTNADDLGEHRPGLRAAGERQVRSPLAELGWTKAMIRSAARELGLPLWDAPAAPCLSSRVEYGLEITAERLRQVEQGEAFLRGLGVTGDLRVRHHGDRARIEVLPPEFAVLEGAWDAIEAEFSSLGFDRVELDPRGYRRGGLLSELPVLRSPGVSRPPALPPSRR